MPRQTPPHSVERPARLLSREHWPIAIGAIAIVTLQAFENRAVVSIVPTVVQALDGWSLFGAASGLALVTFTLGMAVAGTWTDRTGARRVLLCSLTLFGSAQVVSGLAPTMTVFVLGRGLSGLAEATTDTALTVVVARTLPESLRARVFAVFAAAWVLPSLVGPSLAGAIELLAGWRLVFLAPLSILPVTLFLLGPTLARLRPPAPDDRPAWSRTHIGSGVVLAGSLTLLSLTSPLFGSPGTHALGVASIAAGAALATVAGRKVLPPGTLVLRPGLPAVLGLRLMTAASFGLAGATTALMLTTLLGAGPALAGLSMSITGTLWAVGSAVSSHERVQGVAHGPRLRVALLAIALGSLGPALLAIGTLSLVPGMALWAAAALGMGLASPTLSTRMLELSPPAEHGQTSAASGLALAIGAALATALSGAVVAAYGEQIGGRQFAAISLSGTILALIAALVACRIDLADQPSSGTVAAISRRTWLPRKRMRSTAA